MTAQDTMAVAGRVPDSVSMQLISGWNLVGYPVLGNSTVSEIFDSISYSTVEGFYDRDPYFLQKLSLTSVLTPGYGYWIFVTGDQMLTIINR
ncbi:MAG: hypothetical protein V3U51_05710 [Thermoplasmata archaeon]